MKKLYTSLFLLLLLIPGHLLAACVNTIDVNESESDIWEASCESENRAGSYAKYFTFTLANSREITIDLASTKDTYLFLLNGTGKNGTVIEENDDIGPGNSNSKITRVLPAGSYTVEATTFQPATTGNFNVSVVTTTAPSEDCFNPINLNEDEAGVWASDCSSTNRAGSYAKYYTFVVSVAQDVVIDLTSSVDPYLFLLQGSGSEGAIVEQDDNGGVGSNSRISRYLAAGSYTIEATTRSASATGSFTVRVTANAVLPPSACEKLINPNDEEDGVWAPDCTSENREGRYARYYTFTLGDTQDVEIELESSRDSYMFLLDGAGRTGQVLAENDDGGTGDNARIFMTLTKGTYTIEATTFGAAVTGSFTVTISSSDESCDDCPFQINAGLNDAWFNSITNGQGFNITVYPKLKQVFVTWFTFDTERPPEDVTAMLGGPGQRWLTAQGPFEDDTATLTIYVTTGGVFDSAKPVTTTDQDGDGTMILEFSGCELGLVTYEITSLDISGEIPIERIVDDNVELCEMLADP